MGTRKHGWHGTPEYVAWKNMRLRCRNPKRPDWLHYGGRGIRVAAVFEDFAAFLAYVGPRPAGMTLHRIDNDGDYAPGNIQWATKRVQAMNRSDNRHLTYGGQTKTLTEWSEATGVSAGTLWERLRAGWSVERALSERLWTITEAAHAGADARWG